MANETAVVRKAAMPVVSTVSTPANGNSQTTKEAQMELTYTKAGDYYLPNLAAPDAPAHPIGKYGRMRKRYLKEHHRTIFESMVLDGSLWAHIAEIDQASTERMKLLIPAMAKQEGVTEELKASAQMEWVGRMNSIYNRAEEIVLNDFIFSD